MYMENSTCHLLIIVLKVISKVTCIFTNVSQKAIFFIQMCEVLITMHTHDMGRGMICKWLFWSWFQKRIVCLRHLSAEITRLWCSQISTTISNYDFWKRSPRQKQLLEWRVRNLKHKTEKRGIWTTWKFLAVTYAWCEVAMRAKYKQTG